MDSINRYKAYMRWVFTTIYISVITFIVLLCTLAVSFNVVNWLFWFCLFLLLVFIPSEILIVKTLNKKSTALKEEAYGKQAEFSRTGLFKEIWDAYEDNQFEGFFEIPPGIHKTKILYIDDYNNTIDVSLMYRKHEFDIEFSETSIDMIADDETNDPKEKTILLEDLHDIGDVFIEICSFISDCSVS